MRKATVSERLGVALKAKTKRSLIKYTKKHDLTIKYVIQSLIDDLVTGKINVNKPELVAMGKSL